MNRRALVMTLALALTLGASSAATAAAPAAAASTAPAPTVLTAPAINAVAPAAVKAGTKMHTASPVNLRTSNTTKAKAVSVIPRNITLTPKSVKGSWVKVTHKSKTGWVHTSNLKKGAAPSAKAGVKMHTASPVNLRTSNTTKAKAVSVIPRNITLTPKSVKGSWVKVTHKSKTGWVHTSNLKKGAASNKIATPAQAKAYAKTAVAKRGWSTKQYTCLVTLWNRESGWRVKAANPSGAYGIPQALPGSKMKSKGSDWRTSAETQISWGIGYIKSRYSTPCAALSHSDRRGWY
ncbi:SH3 domain-containing protein [Microbacterium sp. NIBRBAC000506063]|uniref:SH3 domain-containing protein n=1 Tax=Microbacterium sp. NIBRBAC000506063 TaxID=2734618 RepID=UPI001BB6009D|nr:SH3 domain-containing protein [Microbacterium sp. NIBRBAC000506063]QTV80974.1 SH3 domain-containing protein [Microbacterium sp. NIBRBAC000506063]